MMDHQHLLIGRLEQVVAAQPSRPACRFLAEHGDATEWSYSELRRRWEAVAAALIDRRSSGERVLLLLPQGLDFAAAFFGCLAAGATAVPVFPPRPHRPSPRLERIAVDAEPRIILTDRATRDQLAEHLPRWPELARLPWLAVDELEDAPTSFTARDVKADTPAFLQYTSGSTGDPKGVIVGHGNLLHNLQMIGASVGRTEDVSTVTWQPLYHDMGLIGGLIEPLLHRGVTTLMSPALFLQKPRAWLEAIHRYRGTHCGGPNFGYDLCVERTPPEAVAELDLSSWHWAFCGAEPIRPTSLARFAEKFGPAGFRREAFYPCYGLAESTLIVSGGLSSAAPKVLTVDRDELTQHRVVPVEAERPEARSFVSCGGRLLDQEFAIVDPETRQPLAENAVGEIWVRGPSVALGYWNRPELSAEVFQARRADGEAGYLRTGDLGFLHDGELYVAGRLKDLIILRGSNIYPQDVEQTMAAAHPAVAAFGSAAFGVEIDGAEKLVVVCETSREHRRGNLHEITAAVREGVTAEFGIAPHAVVLIKPHSLPRTTSGKVRRSAVREAYLAGELSILTDASPAIAAAKPIANGRHVNGAAPTTEVAAEQLTCAAVSDWLAAEIARRCGRAVHEIDRTASFDRFGVDSSAAVEISAALEQRLNRKLSATLVYEYSTIARLADYLTRPAVPAEAAVLDQGVEPLAVIGMGCRFPGGADSPAAYWRLLQSGTDAVVETPPDRWNRELWYDADCDTPGKLTTRHGGFLRQSVYDFDAGFFGIAPREAAALDPQQRLLLEIAWEALEDAGVTLEQLRADNAGVFVGLSTNDYNSIHTMEGNPRAIDSYSGSGSVPSLAAGRLSYFLGVRGPCVVVDTACSSSLAALHSAGHSLRSGECRTALVGGVNLMLTPFTSVFFTKMHAMAADGKCKTFDAAADGYVRGEGCGVIVLKRLADAVRDGDRIAAVIRGSAVNHGGQAHGLFAPNAEGQQQVIRQAMRAAGVAPAEIDYVEAHGTGTSLGDPIELRALAAAVGTAHTPDQPLRIGASKTNIGHLEAAAGMAGLIKTILSLEHEELTPLLHFRRLNPHISLEEGRLELVTEPTPWPRNHRRRLAGVSSFGFGGTNSHVIVEESPPRIAVPQPAEPSRERLLVLSAPTIEALRRTAGRYAEFLASESAPLDDVCYSAAATRNHFRCRLACTASTRTEFVRQLRQYAQSGAAPQIVQAEAPAGVRPRVAWLFTGQGSQYPGMARDLYETFPLVRQILDRCDVVLRDVLPTSLLETLLSADAESSPIHATAYAQPALFALEYAVCELWRSWGVEPANMLGHSLGEYVAACMAGVLSWDEALVLTARRGRLMHEAPGDGLMAALAADEATVVAELTSFGTTVSIAAVNGPRNTVVSGPREAVQRLIEAVRRRGIAAQALNASHAFHSVLMDPVLAPFAAEAEKVRYAAPRGGWVSNVTGKAVGPEVASADYWARHLRATVRFAEGLATLVVGSPGTELEFAL